MSLGLGIFLSSLFLGIIFLFIATKDRWNWKKILFIWPLSIVFVVGVVGGIGDYIYNQYENKPITYDTYWDIPLHSKVNDILFLKGKASSISHAENYDQKEMNYKKNNATFYDIKINDINIKYISCRFSTYLKKDYEISRCESLNHININSSVDEVKALIGEPNSEYESDSKLLRTWIYEKYKTYYVLQKGKVIELGIYNQPFDVEVLNNTYKYKVIELWGGDLIKYVPRFPGEEQLNNVKAALVIAKKQNPQTTEFIWDDLVEIHEKQKAELLTKIGKAQAKAKAEEPDNVEAKQDSSLAEAILAKRLKDSWSAIKKGLATYQVEEMLGKPIREEGSILFGQKLYWYYSEDRRDGAHVYFTKNYDIDVAEVAGWKAP